MTIAQSDLVIYPSANMPLDDASTSGGAEDTVGRIIGTILESDEMLEVVSTAADTRVVTIRGRTFGGHEVVEQLTLNGTTPVLGHVTFYRVLEVTITDGIAFDLRQQSDSAVILTGTANITKHTTLFKYAFPIGGSIARYEKVFLSNDSAETLTEPGVLLFVGPSNLTYAIAGSVDDSGSVSNRLTAPSGLTFSVVGTRIDLSASLLAGEAIGVWLKNSSAVLDVPAIANAQTRVVLIGGTV